MLIPSQLTVLTTSQCTAKCGHCTVYSSPERRDRLSVDEMISAISAIHSKQGLGVVVFAGGEPTLLGNALLETIAFCHSAGILTRLITNASWAITPEKADAKVRALREAGLWEINISADDWHLPFIPFENVKNAWMACKDKGFGAVVIANSNAINAQINPTFLREQLGHDVAIYTTSATGPENDSAIFEDVPSTNGTRYFIHRGDVQIIGRAREEVERSTVPNIDQRSLRGAKCGWAVTCSTISPKGHLVACCGIEAEGNPVLDFGDLKTASADELIQEANNRIMIGAISQVGPAYLLDFATEKDPSIKIRGDYKSVCEVCEDVTTRPEILATIRKHEHELASRLIVSTLSKSQTAS